MSNLISPMLLKIAGISLIMCALLFCVYVACSLLIIITYYSLLLLMNFIRCHFVLFFGCLFLICGQRELMEMCLLCQFSLILFYFPFLLMLSNKLIKKNSRGNLSGWDITIVSLLCEVPHRLKITVHLFHIGQKGFKHWIRTCFRWITYQSESSSSHKSKAPLSQGRANPQLINKAWESLSGQIKLTHQMSQIPLSVFWSWLLYLYLEHTAGVLSGYKHTLCLGSR